MLLREKVTPNHMWHSEGMQQQQTVHAERASTSEVRRWLDEATQEGRADMADRVGPIAAALQRLNEEVREERAQAAEVAGDYTPHQLQALPCPALPCPALPCPAMPCPALPCVAVLGFICVRMCLCLLACCSIMDHAQTSSRGKHTCRHKSCIHTTLAHATTSSRVMHIHP